MEGAPNQESISKEVLIEALKEKGIDDAEVLNMLIRWTEEKEQQVEREGTRDAQVSFEIERAELYLSAGFIDEGRQALEDALTIATQEGLNAVVQQIEDRLSTL